MSLPHLQRDARYFPQTVGLGATRPPQGFGKKANAAESLAYLLKHVVKLVRFDRRAVVIPSGQEYFVAYERHRPG
jgi:hypothetical protein